jgi:hypothetical protein
MTKLVQLNKLETKLLEDCANGNDIRSSDRREDRAKQKLRRLYLIEYAGTPRRWLVTDEGMETVRSIKWARAVAARNARLAASPKPTDTAEKEVGDG